MKLEVGKYYSNKRGEKVEILKLMPNDPTYQAIGIRYCHDGTLLPEAFMINGESFDGKQSFDYIRISDYDLISEYDYPIFNRQNYPAWAKYIAMDMSGKWYYYNQKPYLELDLPYFSKHQGSYVDKLYCGEIPFEYAPQNFNKDWKESVIELN